MLDVLVENSKFSKPNFISATTKLVFVRVLGSKNKLATNICFVSLYSSSRNIFAIFNSSCTSSIVKSSVDVQCFINVHLFFFKKTLCLWSQRHDRLTTL